MTWAQSDTFHRLAEALPLVAVFGGVVLVVAQLVLRTGTPRQRQVSLEALMLVWAGFAWVSAMRGSPVTLVRGAWSDPGWVGFLWVVGAGVSLAVLLVRVMTVGRGVRRESLADGGEVWVSESGGASAWVVGNRTVVTEGFLAGFAEGTRRHVLRHEAAHVRSWHWWRTWGTAVLASLLWWHPVAWIVARELVTEREIEADQEAAGPDRCGYASAILALARGGEGFAVFGGRRCPRRWEALRTGRVGRWSALQTVVTFLTAAAIVPSLAAPRQELVYGVFVETTDDRTFAGSGTVVLTIEARRSGD